MLFRSVCALAWELLVDFGTSRYRLQTEGQQYHQETEKLYPIFAIRVFDGQAIKAYRPRERNTHPFDGVGSSEPELGVGKGYLGGAAFEMSVWPMFLAHGSVPSQKEKPIPGKLKVLPDGGDLSVYGQVMRDGRPCLSSVLTLVPRVLKNGGSTSSGTAPSFVTPGTFRRSRTPTLTSNM